MHLHKSIIYLGILIFAIGTYFGLNSHTVNERHSLSYDFSKAPLSIFDYDDAVFVAFEHPIGGHKGWLQFPDNLYTLGGDSINYRGKWSPYLIGSLIVRNLLNYDRNGRKDSDQLDQCIVHMERMKAIFDRNGNFPRPAYKIMGEGWVSSMDAPTVMVASRMLYEITKDEKWHDFVKVLAAYVVKEISEGGFNFRLDEEDAIWPLEYAEKDIPYDKAYFVLNGSLCGFVGTFIVASVEQDDVLKGYLERVGKGYEKMLFKFPYERYTWTNYMLHPITVCTPHYVMYEWQLFYSLVHLTKAPLFQNEFEYRTACLKSVLKPQFKQLDGKTWFIIHRACAPHPYLIDCYPSKIVFYDVNNQEIGSYMESRNGGRGFEDTFAAGEFLFGEVPEGAVRYAYFREDLGYEIFSGDIRGAEDFVNESDSMRVCEYILRVENDAEALSNGDIHIANNLSEKLEGTLIFELRNIEKLDDNYLYGIEIENLMDMELSEGVIIRGTNAATRYYPSLYPGKNLVLLNILGFRDLNKIDMIKRIDLRLYTNNKNVDGICRVGRILRFKDLFELREYRMNSGYEIPLQ